MQLLAIYGTKVAAVGTKRLSDSPAIGQFLARFTGLPGKMAAQGMGVDTIHSAAAVMDPENETVRRNSLVGMPRTDLAEDAESLLEKAGDDQQVIWLGQMRSDPIYCVYNWEFCQVIIIRL